MDSIGGSKYFITFIDDFSRYVCVYYLKQKSEALSKFKEFVNLMTNITGKRVKVLRSDNGGEYCSHAFAEYLKEQGIKHETTVPYNPAQNGLAERMNRTIVESARSTIHFSNVPKDFWAEAVNTAVYLKNRSPSVALKEETPYECMFGVKPNVSSLKIFGCIAHVHIDSQARKKFDMKSRKAIFVGYPEGTKGFKLYDPVVKRFLCSRDVIFDERKFYDFKEKELSHSNVEIIDYDILPDEQNAENEVAAQDNMRDNAPVGENYEQRFLRELENLPQKRQRKAPRRLIEEEADYCYISDILTADIDEPKSLNEAWNGEYSIHWKEATDSEFSSLQSNDTWDLVPAPKNKNVVGCRWIFKAKRKSNGSLDRFKARLVAQGYTQEQGVDYHEVFAPVVRCTAVRSLLALANNLDLEVHQMDVRTAFLQGTLDADIYMKQPTGYVDKEKPEYVCKLKKSIYGLKQAARCWNIAIDEFLKLNGFKMSGADSCLYVKSVKDVNGNINFVILALYVDDILLMSNSNDMMAREKESLSKRFNISDQGEVHFILGMLIQRNRKERTLTISQPKYFEGVLKRFNMENCKQVSTPLEPGRKFEKLSDCDTPIDTQRYQMIIGCLTYASTATRPDIAAAVSILSQFMAKPGKQHWEGVKRVLRYIKGTLDYSLKYSADKEEITLCGYSDAD